MTTIRYGSSNNTLRGLRTGLEATVSTVETPVGGSISNSVVTSKDITLNRSISTGTINNFNVISVSPNGGTPTYSSNTPNTCSINSAGNVSLISNGVCSIDIVHNPSRLLLSRSISSLTSVTTDTFNSWVSGSLAYHINNNITSMITGNTPGAATQALFTTNNNQIVSPSYTRNVNLFTGGLSLSAISIFSTAHGSDIYPVVLISPWHVMAGHVGVSLGSQILFKCTNGTYEVRNVVGQLKLDSTDNYVGILDTPISTITPMSFMPSNWAIYLPSVVDATTQLNITFPVLNKQWFTGDWIRILECTSISYSFISLRKCTTSPYINWSSDIASGESNGPIFVPINGSAVLLSCMHWTTGSEYYPDYLTDIQAKMNTLGAAQTLTTANLAGFTTY